MMPDSSGRVIWITGLSGAGKTSLAREVVSALRKSGEAVVLLDGDEMRESLGESEVRGECYSRESRLHLAFRYARVSRLIADQGFTVVVSTISLFGEIHAWNRANLPGYFEVYLKVPVEELRRRDPKGIYRRFDTGELTHVAGLDLQIDEPVAADCVLEFVPERTVSELADELSRILIGRK